MALAFPTGCDGPCGQKADCADSCCCELMGFEIVAERGVCTGSPPPAGQPECCEPVNVIARWNDPPACITRLIGAGTLVYKVRRSYSINPQDACSGTEVLSVTNPVGGVDHGIARTVWSGEAEGCGKCIPAFCLTAEIDGVAVASCVLCEELCDERCCDGSSSSSSSSSSPSSSSSASPSASSSSYSSSSSAAPSSSSSPSPSSSSSSGSPSSSSSSSSSDNPCSCHVDIGSPNSDGAGLINVTIFASLLPTPDCTTCDIASLTVTAGLGSTTVPHVSGQTQNVDIHDTGTVSGDTVTIYATWTCKDGIQCFNSIVWQVSD